MDWVFKLNLFLPVSQKHKLSKFIKIFENAKLQSQLFSSKPVISSFKFFSALLGPMHHMFYHCGSLDLDFLSKCSFFVFICSSIIADKIKWCDDYSLHPCQFPLLSTNINLLVSGGQQKFTHRWTKPVAFSCSFI